MTVETATKISQLNPLGPPGSDPKSEGDNHLRLIKSCLQAVFDDSGTTLKTTLPIETPAATIAGPVTMSGDLSGVTSINTGPLGGLHNLIMNGNFRINQRNFAGGALAAGVYGHDRWKADASGCNYSVAGGAATIVSGALIQIIEAANVEANGTYCLSWVGTAAAQVNGVVVANGGSVTLAAGTNQTVRFLTGTVSNVQLELGTKATAFERRPWPMELALCQRYLEPMSGVTIYAYNLASGFATSGYQYKVQKRGSPAITNMAWGSAVNASSVTVTAQTNIGCTIQYTVVATGQAVIPTFTAMADAEI